MMRSSPRLPGDVDSAILPSFVARLCLHLRAGRDVPNISRFEGTERILLKISYQEIEIFLP